LSYLRPLRGATLPSQWTLPAPLYVHIPYCQRKCPYCAFNSYSGRGDEEVRTYVDALLLELAQIGQRADLETVYIGGGRRQPYPLKSLRGSCWQSGGSANHGNGRWKPILGPFFPDTWTFSWPRGSTASAWESRACARKG